jgi:plasmid maintenance system antidote protein VapI
MVAEDGGDGWSEGRNSVPKISRPTLSSLLNGNADLSEDMALRIEKAFGVKMDTLMRVQSSYDIAQTLKREKQIRVPRISLLAATH